MLIDYLCDDCSCHDLDRKMIVGTIKSISCQPTSFIFKFIIILLTNHLVTAVIFYCEKLGVLSNLNRL